MIPYFIAAKIDAKGNTTYLNLISGYSGWEDHPAKATPFWTDTGVCALLTLVDIQAGERLEVMKVKLSCEYVRAGIARS